MGCGRSDGTARATRNAHETALAEFTVHDPVPEARRLDCEFEADLYAALVEVAVRDALVRQRNVGHQTAKKGRELLSAPVSFNRACEPNGAWPSGIYASTRPRTCSFQVPDSGPDWSVFEMRPRPAQSGLCDKFEVLFCSGKLITDAYYMHTAGSRKLTPSADPAIQFTVQYPINF